MEARRGVGAALALIRAGTECEWCHNAAAKVGRPTTGGVNLICRDCAGGRTLEGEIEQQRRAFKRANPNYAIKGEW